LGFDQSISTALFHTNELLSYFFPIIGAVIADSYWGLFKTLTIMSFIFAMGVAIVSIGAIEMLNLPARFGLI
jgi:solute carrier family 15 oligopeptide transporter 1